MFDLQEPAFGSTSLSSLAPGRFGVEALFVARASPFSFFTFLERAKKCTSNECFQFDGNTLKVDNWNVKHTKTQGWNRIWEDWIHINSLSSRCHRLLVALGQFLQFRDRSTYKQWP
jgi:hypothetical protein